MNYKNKLCFGRLIAAALTVALIIVLSLAIPAIAGANGSGGGAQAETGKEFFSEIENAELIKNYQAPDYVGDYSGILVRARDNGDSTVTLNHELDLRAFTAKDPLIKFVVIPTAPIEKREQLQTDSVTIKLTDVEDENVFVEIVLNANGDATYPWASYMGARGNGQFLSSYRQTTDIFGRGCLKDILTNFYARPAHNQPNSDVTVMFDYASKTVHAEPIAVSPWLGNKVADLTRSDVMGGNWCGFKSGRVRLTVTGGSSVINNKGSGILITQIGNLDLSAESWTDTEAPRLRIDTLGYGENDLPDGKMFEKYPVFAAEAYDMFDTCYGEAKGEKEVSVTVERVAGNKVTEIPVADGCIVPMDMGAYRIRYRAEDAAGFKSEKTLEFYVRDAFVNISHEWAAPFAEVGCVGEKISVPDDRVLNASGKYEKTYEVFETASGRKLEIIDGAFTPVATGTHTVRVNVSDFLGRTATFEYFADVKARKTPVVFGEPSLPPCLIAGKITSLPDFEAYDYYSVSGERIAAEKTYAIYGASGDMLVKVKPEESFAPRPEWGEKVRIECKVTSVLYSDSVEYVKSNVIVLNRAEEHRLGDYFRKSGITATEYNFSSGRNVTFKFDSEDAKIEFGSPLMLGGMSMAIRVPSGYGNYGSIIITLTDYANASKSVRLAIAKPASSGGENSLFSVNGGEQTQIRGTFDGRLLDDFVINIDSKYGLYDVRGNSLGTLSEYASGEAFEGFTDNMCYATFSFEDVTGDSAMSVILLGNTYFSDSTSDFLGPVIGLRSPIEIEQYVGEITLPGAVASDVQFGKADTRLLVTAPDGRTVYNGPASAETIQVDAPLNGSYSVSYSARDDRNTPSVALYTVYVYKRTMPEVSTAYEIPTSGKAGEKIALPGIKFEGEIKDVTVFVYVIDPSGRRIDVNKTFEFTPERAGVYEAVYCVIDDADSSYNYKLIRTEITVVE